MSDLDLEFSRSLKAKCDSAIGLAEYGFLLMFNTSTGPT